ncbi:MAG: hypothetical protein IT369_18450 [Candidatus Latescibacteria bacterium]|nr:hypothetical protein [Candidatus Latescibacterota bacterium]
MKTPWVLPLALVWCCAAAVRAEPATAAAGPAPAPSLAGVPAAHRAISPVDTMKLSLLERAFWGRHGLMRTTHLFRLDEQNPRNDFRQMAHARRKMLSTHQMMGLATAISMAVTVYGGQHALNTGDSSLHKASLPFTIGLYSATAALALASPPKLIPSRGGRDTITFHKYFAALHMAGMIVTPLIAPGGSDPMSVRRRHQISGYTTFGAFTSGILVVTVFK